MRNPKLMASKLFYHIIWHHGGSPSELIASLGERSSNYPAATKKIDFFDTYQYISAKDHERIRLAYEIVIDYNLFIASCLPKRDAIMKSKSKKAKTCQCLV